VTWGAEHNKVLLTPVLDRMVWRVDIPQASTLVPDAEGMNNIQSTTLRRPT
jgi:hypothetical protein